MQKTIIHLYGASGSGTSTLGGFVSEKLGYAFMDSDDYYWLKTKPEYTVSRDIPERLRLMEKDIMESKGAVISGSLVGWGDPLIPLFTLAVRIVTETDIRVRRLIEREKERFGSRILPGEDRHGPHLEFIAWAASYDTAEASVRSKAMHDAWQELLPCPKITLNGADPLDANLERIKKALASCNEHAT